MQNKASPDAQVISNPGNAQVTDCHIAKRHLLCYNTSDQG